MYGSAEQGHSRNLEHNSRFGLTRANFAIGAFVVEVVAIVLVAVATGIVYHLVAYGDYWAVDDYAQVGALAGLIYGLSFLIRDEYGVEKLLEGRRTNSRLFLHWNMVFVGLAVVGFLTKSTALVSRGWIVLFYATGLVAVVILNALIHRALAALTAHRLLRRRKMLIMGTEDDIARLSREIMDGAVGVDVVQTVAVPTDALQTDLMDEILDATVNNMRALGIDDVVLSSGLANQNLLERAVAAFNLLPVSIHLGAGGIVSQFKEARISRFGRATTLSLTREPLGPFEALTKRTFDIVCAGLALVVLMPLFVLIALVIRLDSKGPVFFLQRRRGFNLEEFEIWKFRTMMTLENGDVVQQATKNDARVTRVGKFLRKYSLDELPQLFNVFRGEMSLVGPRPHAVAHDQFYERRIALYPRRLNMKPGITGWAQVNGFRGATNNDEAMRQRVDHDLYYIDNCSLAFDLYIVFLTLASPKARRNAY